MTQPPKTVRRLNDPDLRHAEVALHRAAKKAQRRAREAGLEPVVYQPEPNDPSDHDGPKC